MLAMQQLFLSSPPYFLVLAPPTFPPFSSDATRRNAARGGRFLMGKRGKPVFETNDFLRPSPGFPLFWPPSCVQIFEWMGNFLLKMGVAAAERKTIITDLPRLPHPDPSFFCSFLLPLPFPPKWLDCPLLTPFSRLFFFPFFFFSETHLFAPKAMLVASPPFRMESTFSRKETEKN